MTIRLHKGDLPNLDRYGDSVAIDTETLGLTPLRDRLCVRAAFARAMAPPTSCRSPRGRLGAQSRKPAGRPGSDRRSSTSRRFDIAVLAHAFGVFAGPVYCTKIASRLTRTYTDRHGLKDLARELVGIDMSKQQQSSDWAAAN